MDLNQILALANDPKIRQLIQSLLSGGGGQSSALTGGSGAGAQNGGLGGLTDLLGKLNGDGMQQEVKSWVGPGENQPVTGEQVQHALGQDTLAKAAEQVGMSPQEAADGLANALPQMVDKATPEGSLPGGVGASQ